ncbi:MAG TPA: prolyl oligopeptidase family serine peptidase [Terriglobales bacterium]
MKLRPTFLAVVLSAAAVAASAPTVIHGGGGVTLPAPPTAPEKPVTETLHGVTITDPYRWLEDQNAPETRAWINQEMQYTKQYLEQVKNRPQIQKRIAELTRIEAFTIPYERDGVYFFSKRQADENQGSIYMRKGIRGADVRLVDATKLSTDQNTSVTIEDISEDGALLVYGIREGGADEMVVKTLDVNANKELPDVLPKARYSTVSLSPDRKGFYYSRFEKEGSTVHYHAFGTPVDSDAMIFGKKVGDETLGPMELIGAEVSQNGHYLVIDVSHGVPAKRVDVYVKDLRTLDSAIKPVIHGIDNRFIPQVHEDDLYVLTDYKAENYQIVKVSIADPAPEKWQTIVPESKDVIADFAIAGGRIFAGGLHDVAAQTRIFNVTGKQLGTIPYPGIGASSRVRGRDQSKEAFYSFESFNLPPTIFHYDIPSGKAEVFAKPNVPFNSDAYQVKQVFYNSKDGTRVPMFISSKKGSKQDGTTPTLMFAYGGFNLSMVPSWNPEWAWWMEQGGNFALPNLRAGGEYGEAWHKAGMFEKKQNVFDDFYSAAEYLIQNNYTSASELAVRGRSNGGLLMGAAMTQRPDLFGAIWCGFPLLDMLRFQNFLVGRWWTAEYGSAEDAEQFKYLLKYSPYQNVKAGTKYPAIMFNTGDADTRVAPLHARKMTALMQKETGSDRPIILHYETKAGHSSGVSIQQLIDDTTDELAFLWNETANRKWFNVPRPELRRL